MVGLVITLLPTSIISRHGCRRSKWSPPSKWCSADGGWWRWRSGPQAGGRSRTRRDFPFSVKIHSGIEPDPLGSRLPGLTRQGGKRTKDLPSAPKLKHWPCRGGLVPKGLVATRRPAAPDSQSHRIALVMHCSPLLPHFCPISCLCCSSFLPHFLLVLSQLAHCYEILINSVVPGVDLITSSVMAQTF